MHKLVSSCARAAPARARGRGSRKVMPCWPCRNPELAEQHDCKGHQVCAEPQSRPRWGPESNAMHGDSWVLSPWPPMQTAPVSAAYRSNLHRNGGGGSSSAVHTAVAASTSLDSHIRVWNVETGQADKVFDCGPGAACHISCACKMRIRDGLTRLRCSGVLDVGIHCRLQAFGFRQPQWGGQPLGHRNRYATHGHQTYRINPCDRRPISHLCAAVSPSMPTGYNSAYMALYGLCCCRDPL